ncbi:MAG: flippase-like domain-containing protein, partial [Gemmatimonadetes bacterium]|nr:flippase-like domain-containing protein [Gemmatimonadota bacterium]
MNKHLTRFAKIAISALLLGLIISRMNAENVLQTLRAVDLRFALAALAVSHLDRFLQAGKWWLLLRQSGQQLPLRIAIANTYVGNFAGLFLPASVGGDFVRVFLLKAFPIQMSEVVASIVVERVFGVLALVFTAAGALLLADTAGVQVPEPVRWLVLPVFGGLLVAIAASFRLRSGIPAFVLRLGERFHLQRRLESLTGSYRRYGKRKVAILTYFVLSVVEVLTVTVIFLLMARAVGIPLPPA